MLKNVHTIFSNNFDLYKKKTFKKEVILYKKNFFIQNIKKNLILLKNKTIIKAQS